MFQPYETKKYKCQLNGATIDYNNRSYEHKDLNCLPEGCKLENTQMNPCDNNTRLCFQGAHAYVSNFYSAPIVYQDNYFTSAEQAFQWKKNLSQQGLCRRV